MGTIETLREEIRGDIVTSADAEYDAARAVYNAMIDRRPAAVVRCVDVADVIAAVRHATDNGLRLAVRGGSHSVPGFGTVDDGVVVDLSALRNVRVDPRTATATVGGGATWGDFNHATYPFGLATTGGIISTTGVAGLTLGGGIGYLARSCGLSCDNLLEADVVTANGELVRANEDENADLFWALRGGGGNFGVVTTLKFRLHQVKDVYGGVMFYEAERSGDVLRFFRSHIADAPLAFGGFPAFQIAPPLPFIPENRHGEPFVVIVACWSGPLERGENVLKPFHDIAPVVAEMIGPMPYPALNSAFDALVPKGLQHYWKANFVTELTDEAISAHETFGPKVPYVSSTMHLYPINGAVHDVASDATAFAYRDANFAEVIAGMWLDPADNDANTKWVRDYYAATAPQSEEGGYVNFMSADDQGRVRANYKANYARLVDVKRRYDPSNVFRLNQNIVP
ncbi:MAG TPA: FAD-binding oxidoreductase [Acidothermaceae bacterium]|jgi:FAD/FMN-containing dehydrogenase